MSYDMSFKIWPAGLYKYFNNKRGGKLQNIDHFIGKIRFMWFVIIWLSNDLPLWWVFISVCFFYLLFISHTFNASLWFFNAEKS